MEGFSDHQGRLLKISTGGALIVVEKVGGPHRPLWIRLERAPETGWIAADIARFKRPQDLAIRFRSPCPVEFYLAATFRTDPEQSADSEQETPRGRSQYDPLAGTPGELKTEPASGLTASIAVGSRLTVHFPAGKVNPRELLFKAINTKKPKMLSGLSRMTGNFHVRF